MSSQSSLNLNFNGEEYIPPHTRDKDHSYLENDHKRKSGELRRKQRALRVSMKRLFFLELLSPLTPWARASGYSYTSDPKDGGGSLFMDKDSRKKEKHSPDNGEN